MPRSIPEARYFSMPSRVVGDAGFKNVARNCMPWLRSLAHTPLAWTNSPDEISGTWPTTVTASRWPRALRRSTQNPFSGLWNTTRSTDPANTSVGAPEGAAACAIPDDGNSDISAPFSNEFAPHCHSGAQRSCEPGIHAHRPVFLDSGLRPPGGPGMTIPNDPL